MRSAVACAVMCLAMVSLCGVTGAHGEEKRVLFIGNSYSGQTASALQGFADADPNTTLSLGLAVMGGSWLSWHYANRDKDVYRKNMTLVEMLRSQRWDAVFLQEFSTGPTHIGNVPAFMQASRDLATLIRTEAPSAEVWFYETWARRGDNREFYPQYFSKPEEMQAELRENYGNAANSVGGTVAGIGDAWEMSYFYRLFNPNDPNSFTLHDWDTSHPNAYGKYLTGAVIFGRLFQRNPVGSSYRSALSPEDALFLQRVAALTNAGFKGTRLGDMDCDETVDFGDVNPFVLALSDARQYEEAFPACTVLNADCNRDGTIDFGDVKGFIELLSR